MKKLLLVILIGVFVFGVSSILSAQAVNTEQSKKAEDVGNKICPVSGEKIDEKLKVTYEYKGKIYNFCCAACVDDFKKDPDKYIKKIEAELQAESKERAGHKEHKMEMMQEPEGMPKGMHEGH